LICTKNGEPTIEWIGEIPEHWEVRPISRSFELVGSGTTPKSDNEIYYLEGVHNWLLTGDLNDGFIFETSKKITDEAISEHSTLKKYPVNSIVMAMYGATIGKLGILKVETTVNQACCVLANSNVFDYRIPFYFLLVIRQEIINLSFGGGQPNISQEIVKRIKIPVPPFAEQTAIANYLDTKTTEIDQVVADKEALINLYELEKKALINEAVTKGVTLSGVETSAVKLKPSGIDWLGEIPEHWDVKKLKNVTKSIQTGKTPPTSNEEYFLNDDYNWFTPGDFGNSIILSSSTRKISQLAVDGEGLKLFEKYTVLLVAIGATLGKIGIVSDVCFANQQINSITFNQSEIFPFFGAYFLESKTEMIKKQSVASTLAILNQEKTKELLITVPPLKEQTAIVRHIETETTKINDKINLIKQEIELLKEYRQALIFEVVTGKIQVDNG
jgi:type I restriction enzyme, S subunit